MHQSHDIDSHGHCLVTGPPASCSTHPAFPPSSLGTLSRLPPEIIDRILKLACRAPEKDAKNLKDRSLLALDKKTTLNLCIVSKAVSLIARFQLWESPRITRPSALLELRRTLLGHTCWGKLIKNLHIGGDETLPYTNWPLMMEDKEDGVPHQFPVLWIQTSWGFEDEERLPKWCEPERTWCFDPWRLDCRGKAITAMLFDAMEGIDLEVYKRCYGKSGLRIGLELWATRVFELQAILDLYLIEMRRVEDERNYPVSSWRTTKVGPPQAPPVCRLNKCAHYPDLNLTGWAHTHDEDGNLKPEEEPEENTFTITRAQVWAHLTRRGAPLDQFDHPIIFARCGFRSAPFNEYGRDLISGFLEGTKPDHFTPAEYDPEDSGGDDDDDEEEEQDFDPMRHEECAQKALALAEWNTMWKLTFACIDIVRWSTNLGNLSLNGTLNLCLAGPIETWKTLKTLSLGPLLPILEDGLGLEKKASRFEGLESLRICGAPLDEKEADVLAGAGDGEGFAKLKRFQWEMVQAVRPAARPIYGSDRLLGIITRFQRQRPKKDSEDDVSPSPSRLIEVRLHPDECADILALTSPAQRTALQHGTVQPGFINRVLLTESEAAKSKVSTAMGTRRLHGNSSGWLDQCAEDKVRGDDWMPNAEGGGSLAPKGMPKRKIKGLKKVAVGGGGGG